MAGAEKEFHFKGGDDVFRVQAYAPTGTGGSCKAVIFETSRISYIFDGDEEGTSRIRLDSGVVIPVRLSLSGLDEMLHNPNVDLVKNGVIDLSSLTQADQKPVSDLPIISSAKENAENTKPKVVGDVMEDGTIYAGISPKTNKPLYVAPKDAPVAMSFDEAQEYLREFRFGGKSDFRLPTKEEFALIRRNKEKGSLKKTFNESSCYWSSSAGSDGKNACGFSFYNGSPYDFEKTSDRCVRFVRSDEPAKIASRFTISR